MHADSYFREKKKGKRGRLEQTRSVSFFPWL